MKGKKEIIVLIIIIAAVAAYLAFRPTDRATYQLPTLPKIAKETITKIEVTGPENSFTVQRKDTKWFIGPGNLLADSSKIDRILDIVSALKLTAMVSESNSDQLYDLNPEKRIQVNIWADKDLKRAFSIGKSAATFRHTFVKISGDDRVFHGEKNFRDRFEMTVDAMRDKKVMAFKPDEIKSFNITRNGQTTAFKKNYELKADVVSTKKAGNETPSSEKRSFTWVTASGEVADLNKVNAFLFALSGLKCNRYLDDTAKDTLTDPVMSITLLGTKEYQMTVYPHGKKEEESPSWPAQSSENNSPFLLADFTARDIIKAPGDLMPAKPNSGEAVKEE
jgi:hypothetical protein